MKRKFTPFVKCDCPEVTELEVFVNGVLRAVVTDAHNVIDFLGPKDCEDGGRDFGVLVIVVKEEIKKKSLVITIIWEDGMGRGNVITSIDGSSWVKEDIQDLSDRVNKLLGLV